MNFGAKGFRPPLPLLPGERRLGGGIAIGGGELGRFVCGLVPAEDGLAAPGTRTRGGGPNTFVVVRGKAAGLGKSSGNSEDLDCRVLRSSKAIVAFTVSFRLPFRDTVTVGYRTVWETTRGVSSEKLCSAGPGEMSGKVMSDETRQ